MDEVSLSRAATKRIRGLKIETVDTMGTDMPHVGAGFDFAKNKILKPKDASLSEFGHELVHAAQRRTSGYWRRFKQWLLAKGFGFPAMKKANKAYQEIYQTIFRAPEGTTKEQAEAQVASIVKQLPSRAKRELERRIQEEVQAYRLTADHGYRLGLTGGQEATIVTYQDLHEKMFNFVHDVS